MKKILLLALSYCLALNGIGQTNEEFVEVIVSDTLEAEAEEIFYTVYCFDEEETTDTTGKKMASTGSIEMSSTEKTRLLIIKSGIDTIPASPFSFQNKSYSYDEKNIFNLRFQSAEKLRAFITAIKEIKATAGFISRSTTSKNDMLVQQLTSRMLKKAQADAIFIAGQSGKKLGKLLQVKEDSAVDASGGWTVYPPLSALGQSSYDDSVSGKVLISRRFVVRYLWQ